MNVQLTSRRSAGGGFVSKPNIAKYGRVNCKIKSVVHPPRQTAIAVVISPNQHFAPRKVRVHIPPPINPTNEHIPQVNYKVTWLYRIAPISNENFGKVLGAVTVRRNLGVIEVGVRN